MAKYTQEQRDEAVALFNELGSVTATIRRLGYPTRTMLYKWVSHDDAAHNRGEEARYLQYDPAVKATAVRMCDSTHDARSVAKLLVHAQPVLARPFGEFLHACAGVLHVGQRDHMTGTWHLSQALVAKS